MVQPDGEDDASIAQHIAAMKGEMAKTMPDVNFILDRMTRTFTARRKFIQDSSLTAVLEEYPALTLDSVVSQEMRCYSHVEIDIRTCNVHVIIVAVVRLSEIGEIIFGPLY